VLVDSAAINGAALRGAVQAAWRDAAHGCCSSGRMAGVEYMLIAQLYGRRLA
jgi:hypothetical protein